MTQSNSGKEERQGQQQHHVVLRSRDEETGEVYYEFHGDMLARRIRVEYGYTRQSAHKKGEEVENDRSLAIEMTIVKVMKARKRLKFDLLIGEVLELLKHFSPSLKVPPRLLSKSRRASSACSTRTTSSATPRTTPSTDTESELLCIVILLFHLKYCL